MKFATRNVVVCCVAVCFVWCNLAYATIQNQETDLSGYYTLDGKITKAFADISELFLATGDVRGGKFVKVPLYGFIRLATRAKMDFYLVKPTLTGKNFTFTTKKIKGVSYEFSGTFTKLGNFPDIRPEEAGLLKEHLVKLLNDNKVAEIDASFTYSAGG